MDFTILDSKLYAEMIRRGAGNLKIHAEEVNNLNVFPIPDGDTGDNMLLTMKGGVNAVKDEEHLGKMAAGISKGMLLGARGNSGVILSQFFDGISAGLVELEKADLKQVSQAFKLGVKHAYDSVVTPTEGTILTVAKDSVNAACNAECSTLLEFIEVFLSEAEKSLERTPDLLPVLKKAGVVDSGGAGLIYIVRGFRQVLLGETEESHESLDQKTEPEAAAPKIDVEKFTEDSVLEFGYCTELLLRLQNAKCDPKNFDVNIIKNYLETIGNSVVIFKTDSIVKMHVHTMEPYRVLQFCQQYGEYLTVKIENMSLQHNNISEENEALTKNYTAKLPPQIEHKKYALVVCATGEGIKQLFIDNGADQIVEGGQSMNPSAEDFINAFKKIDAETIFVFPNNSNVILSAKQAAEIYKEADVRVVESKSIGDGYAAIAMMDPDKATAEEVMEDFDFAMSGVDTYLISHCIRDAEMDGVQLHNGEYIGFLSKKLVGHASKRDEAVKATIDNMDFTDKSIVIMIRGNDSISTEFEELQDYLKTKNPGLEVYAVDGMQDIYSYIMIVQ